MQVAWIKVKQFGLRLVLKSYLRAWLDIDIVGTIATTFFNCKNLNLKELDF